MIDVDWRQPFIDYIREQKVPSDKNVAEQLVRRAKTYVLVGDKLYRRHATSGILMKCVPREEGKDILEEIHKGVCSNHAASHTLVSNVVWTSLAPLPRRVPRPTTRWAPGITRLVIHGT
jgi:hypothetical protein